jgi:hypothetical protein
VEDALIAGMMCWALYRKKTGITRWDFSFNVKISHPFLYRTDSMLMTLMAYTLNSGLLTW